MIRRMRWCEPGDEEALQELRGVLQRTVWPGPPPGFVRLAAPRPMRTVLRGAWRGAHGTRDVVVKWSRPDTLTDRVSARVRGGKGVREGRVLRRLGEAGVPAPRVVAFDDEGVDVLVTLHEPDLADLPPADIAAAQEVAAVATLLARAHEAGLRHRDLHAGNLALRDGAPVLVDLGGARVGGPLDATARRHELARLAHGLLGGARRTQRLRALIAYEAARGATDARQAARRQASGIEAAAREVRRRYRRGRDRRAARTGKHFAAFSCGHVARGMRFKDTTDESWEARADAWLGAPPAGAVALKAGGGVLRVGPVVLKYYEGVARGRLPRPVRAFRRACALLNRGVAVPLPHLAAARADGSGVYAAAYVDAPDLHACVARGDVDEWHLRRVGRALRLLHDAEVTDRDLKAPNLLVDTDGCVRIADLEGVRIRGGPVPWARRARDLMRLDASLDLAPALRRHVLEGYHDALPRPPVSLVSFADHVAALAARKRGPSGRPR